MSGRVWPTYIECRPRRQTRPERHNWRNSVAEARFNPLGSVAQEVTRPYLLAHPEREIAEVDSIGPYLFASCPACGEGAIVGTSARDTPWSLANEHNALIHPRRAARLTK